MTLEIDNALKGLQAEMAALYDEADALLAEAEKENRSLTDEEEGKHTAALERIDELEVRLQRLTKHEQARAKLAVPVQTIPPEHAAGHRGEGATPGLEVKGSPKREPGILFAQMAQCLFQANGSMQGAAMIAKDVRGDLELAAVLALPPSVYERAAASDPAMTTVPGWAGALTAVRHAGSEFIELLRPLTIKGRILGRPLTFGTDGSIKIPRQTGGVVGGWVEEGKGIPVQEGAFDSLTLSPKKMAVIVAATAEQLAHSDPSAAMLIRDDMLQGTARTVDAAFIDATAASAARPAGIQVGGGTQTASGDSTLDAINAELKVMTGAFATRNMPTAGGAWIINPQNVNALLYVRDGNGNLVYADQVLRGSLQGFPLVDSTTVPVDELMLVMGAQILEATDLAPTITMSTDATLHMEDTAPNEDIAVPTSDVRSLFQTDSVALRLVHRLDWGKRYDLCVETMSGLDWIDALP